MTNYAMTAPTAGAARSSSPTEVELWTDAVANFNLLGQTVPAGMFIGPTNPTRGTYQFPADRIGTWLRLENKQAIDQLVFEVTTGGDASAVITCAIYSVNGTTMTRVAKGTAIDATTVAIKTDSVSATLDPGWYIGVLEQTGHSATRPTVRSTFTSPMNPLMDSSDLMSNPRGGLHPDALANASGLPASFTLVTGTSRAYGPVVGLRCA